MGGLPMAPIVPSAQHASFFFSPLSSSRGHIRTERLGFCRSWLSVVLAWTCDGDCVGGAGWWGEQRRGPAGLICAGAGVVGPQSEAVSFFKKSFCFEMKMSSP